MFYFGYILLYMNCLSLFQYYMKYLVIVSVEESNFILLLKETNSGRTTILLNPLFLKFLKKMFFIDGSEQNYRFKTKRSFFSL